MNIKEILEIYLIPTFNIVFGIYMALTGLGLVKPFQNSNTQKKYKFFFIIGGIAMFIWGVLNLFW